MRSIAMSRDWCAGTQGQEFKFSVACSTISHYLQLTHGGIEKPQCSQLVLLSTYPLTYQRHGKAPALSTSPPFDLPKRQEHGKSQCSSLGLQLCYQLRTSE